MPEVHFLPAVEWVEAVLGTEEVEPRREPVEEESHRVRAGSERPAVVE